MPDTSIPIDSDVRDQLRGEKRGGETYSEAILRLLSRPPREFQIRFQELDNDRPMSYEFVEVETRDGKSISIGEWASDGDYQLLVVDNE